MVAPKGVIIRYKLERIYDKNQNVGKVSKKSIKNRS